MSSLRSILVLFLVSLSMIVLAAPIGTDSNGLTQGSELPYDVDPVHATGKDTDTDQAGDIIAIADGSFNNDPVTTTVNTLSNGLNNSTILSNILNNNEILSENTNTITTDILPITKRAKVFKA